MRVDLRRIGPFVKRVKFFAPSDGWPWELEDFKGVLFAPAVEKCISDDMDLWIHMYDGQPSYYRSFAEKHWEGDPPFSDDQVLLAFKTYQTDALALRDLLLGELLISAWTEVLQSLQSVVSVKFYSIDFDHPRCQQQAVYPDIVKTHRHHGSRKGGISSLTDGIIGDAVFAAAISCLSQAKVRIKDLKVDCAMTEHFGWEDLPGWNDLGISQLQAFHFSPKVNTISQMGLPEAADAIDAVLRRCTGSLETFTHRAHCVAPWPTDKLIKLPNLRRLSVERGPLHSDNLKRWMAEMFLLEDFYLEFTNVSVGGDMPQYYRWRDVFDAIRNHSRPMLVSFEEIIVNDVREISFEYCTDDFERYLEKREAENPYDDIDRTLALYLSGKIEYNKCLKALLEDEEDLDEEFEDDDEDNDDEPGDGGGDEDDRDEDDEVKAEA